MHKETATDNIRSPRDIETFAVNSGMDFNSKKRVLLSSRANYRGYERSDEQRSWLADKIAFIKRRESMLKEIEEGRTKAEARKSHIETKRYSAAPKKKDPADSSIDPLYGRRSTHLMSWR